jgi:ABC-type phosphate/phosphonate transport system ATPase subunit
MIRIAVVGDIGSGKSHIAKLFNYPVFNADLEVAKIYKSNRKCFKNLKKNCQNIFRHFQLRKKKLSGSKISLYLDIYLKMNWDRQPKAKLLDVCHCDCPTNSSQRQTVSK